MRKRRRRTARLGGVARRPLPGTRLADRRRNPIVHPARLGLGRIVREAQAVVLLEAEALAVGHIAEGEGLQNLQRPVARPADRPGEFRHDLHQGLLVDQLTMIIDVAAVVVLGALGEVGTAQRHVDVGGVVQHRDRAGEVALLRAALLVEFLEAVGESAGEGEGDIMALLDGYGFGGIPAPRHNQAITWHNGVLAGGAVQDAGQDDQGQWGIWKRH